ncbi:MAG: hypothetical protein JW818_14570 [Pirellulales bacterium]|nr:hypothetical protein [Pirellulales bacterium]
MRKPLKSVVRNFAISRTIRGAIGLLAVASVLAATAGWAIAGATAPNANGADAEAQKEPAKYLLRYKFQPGETLSWNVEHRGQVVATIAGVTETVEMVSKSVKIWEAKEVEPDGTVVFENRAEDFDLWHKQTGREPIRYNSATDKDPPRRFAETAAKVGKPLVRFRMDNRGNILERRSLLPGAAQEAKAQITIPLPEEPISIGHSWVFPHEVSIPLETGGVTKIQTQQRFTLESVKTGVARIKMVTQILTPIHNPAVEAKLIDCATRGTIRFDLDTGRVLSQNLELDKQVIGFRGADSRIHHAKRFTERLLPDRLLAARP